MIAIAWLATGARIATGELLLLDGGVHMGGSKAQVDSARGSKASCKPSPKKFTAITVMKIRNPG